jgi:hypothetical protein
MSKLTATVAPPSQCSIVKNNLEHFKILNDWTVGKLWGNLLVVKGRTSFEKSDVESRFQNNYSIFQDRNNDKLVDLLSKRALGTDSWVKKDLGKFAK